MENGRGIVDGFYLRTIAQKVLIQYCVCEA